MSHTCHAPGCSRQVPPKMFACRDHWYQLRKKTRDAIWREYRPGQENDKVPSLRYLAVQRFACAELVFRPNDEKAAHATGVWLAHAIGFQQAAIEAGLGDPLDGLAVGGIVMKAPEPQPKRQP